MNKKHDFSGMTANERLFAAGLLDQFDDSVRRGDRAKMIRIYEAIDLGKDAAALAEAVLNHPTRHGRLKS